MVTGAWRWPVGLIFIFLVATIWIAASYIVQSVVDSGVSPFLITYICSFLFIIYIPIVEIGRYFERSVGTLGFTSCNEGNCINKDLEKMNLLAENHLNAVPESPPKDANKELRLNAVTLELSVMKNNTGDFNSGAELKSETKRRLNRLGVAKISLLISPFWFLAQLSFNLSLKYTTVTSNTILSSASSLFTFLVALLFLGEVFTWGKLFSVLLCMTGTIVVSLGDSGSHSKVAPNPVLGDVLALISSAFYAIYITLIRKNIPDEDKSEVEISMAEVLGYLGVVNLLVFLPVALLLNFTGLERFHNLSLEQAGLIVGKGLLDNVLSDYLWAKAVLLTTTTVATAGLTIQVPLAAAVDSLTGNAPHLLDYVGGAAIMLGFLGMNLPSTMSGTSSIPPEREEDTESDQRPSTDISGR